MAMAGPWPSQGEIRGPDTPGQSKHECVTIYLYRKRDREIHKAANSMLLFLLSSSYTVKSDYSLTVNCSSTVKYAHLTIERKCFKMLSFICLLIVLMIVVITLWICHLKNKRRTYFSSRAFSSFTAEKVWSCLNLVNHYLCLLVSTGCD